MNEIFRDLHDQLLRGIDECEKSHTDVRKHIECCFHICERLNNLVDRQLRELRFANEKDEIFFYKFFRPKFTSLLEFYTIAYRAELFEPETKLDKLSFWKFELDRAQQFLQDNEQFREYINSGNTNSDKTFFLPSSPNSSSYQHLLAQIKAWEIYIEFIMRKLPGEKG